MSNQKKFSPMLGWISLSALDGIGRIGSKVVATVLFARWLTPEIFGQASLTVVVVSVLAIFVAAPFEEALTRRKTIRSGHFATSLLLVLALAAGICALAMAIGWGMDFASADTALVAPLVGMFSLILFAQGPISIYTALARRQRAFKRLALSNLTGDLIGTATGLALAFSGVGVWSLLAVRLVSRFVTLFGLVWAAPVRVAPGFSPPHLRDLSAFAGWSFAGRCVETLSDAVFQGLVARFFGLSGAGYLNMAMRIVEPMKGITAPMGHNIAMSFFVRVQDAPQKLRASVEQTMAGTSLLLAPLFVGLAAAGPTIIAILAGPGWQASAPLVVCLALAAATVSAPNYLQGAFSAKGRADLGFFVTLVEFALMVSALAALSGWGVVAAGLARLVSHVGEVAFDMITARVVLGLAARRTLAAVTPAMLSAGVMGLIVAAVGATPALASHAMARLAAQIVTGVAVYTLLAAVFHRAGLRLIYRRLRGAPAVA